MSKRNEKTEHLGPLHVTPTSSMGAGLCATPHPARKCTSSPVIREMSQQMVLSKVQLQQGIFLPWFIPQTVPAVTAGPGASPRSPT